MDQAEIINKPNKKKGFLIAIIVLLIVLVLEIATLIYSQFFDSGLVYGLDESGNYCVIGYNGNKSEIKIPSIHNWKKVTKIGDNAFESSSIVAVTIPNSVKTIGRNAFSLCKNLKRVYFGKNVKYIGNEAFYYCSSLDLIVIPDSVVDIGQSAFEKCLSLQNINLPMNLEEIKDSTFYWCSSLDNIIIPSGVKSIGSKAFAYSGVVIAFIPDVKYIGSKIFEGCDNLREIYYSGTQLYSGSYYGISQDVLIIK